jgi:hypothetical protein
MARNKADYYLISIRVIEIIISDYLWYSFYTATYHLEMKFGHVFLEVLSSVSFIYFLLIACHY